MVRNAYKNGEINVHVEHALAYFKVLVRLGDSFFEPRKATPVARAGTMEPSNASA